MSLMSEDMLAESDYRPWTVHVTLQFPCFDVPPLQWKGPSPIWRAFYYGLL